MKSDRTIGIVGTGRMGANIARRLKEAGYEIAATYDTDLASARALAEELGATQALAPADVTAGSEVVVTVVSDDAAMATIFAEADGSLLQDCAGRLFVNCATIAPATHVEVQRRCEARGAQSLEACMAGSIPQARGGSLFLMTGGREEAFARARPLLEAMSASVSHVGAAGRAAQVKALVNMVMNANTAALAEGLGLGDALGLDLDMLRDVFAQTGANSRVLQTDGEDMQKREHETYFSADHAAKDSGIALALAREQGLELPVARAAYAQYEKMKTLGLGGLDKSGVAELTFKGRHA